MAPPPLWPNLGLPGGGGSPEKGRLRANMAARLEIINLRKRIGRDEIVRGVSLDARPGEIFGFLGPNGSGKTTTIRMILRLIRPTAGTILVDGKDIRTKAGRDTPIGSLIDPPGLFPYLTARQHLVQIGKLLGLDEMRIEADRILDEVDLVHAANKPARAFSQGMKRRLAVGIAMVGSPNLTILDEPTSGLDPLGILEIRGILRRIVADGKRTVFVSSHLLSEMETECHRIALLSQGELVGLGSVEELLSGEKPVFEAETSDDAKARDLLAAKLPNGGAPRLENKRVLAPIDARDDVPALVKALVAGGVNVYSARARRVTLEEYFVAKTGGSRRREIDQARLAPVAAADSEKEESAA
jgi:ABC-2 type transport system ATP-binding protein